MSFTLLGILNSQAAGAGGAGAYDLLETTISTGSSNSITFTGLDTLAADYKHLQLRMTTRYLNSVSDMQNQNIRLNGSTANYSRHTLDGDGSTVTSTGQTNQNRISLEHSLIGNGATSGAFSAAVIDILDFSATSKNTTLRALHGGTTSAESRITLTSGLYFVTDAITSVEVTTLNNNYVSGSRFSLYGVK